eukprot:SAG31_NODE_36297_length_314_cov_1.297674_2_plen_41_part_01
MKNFAALSTERETAASLKLRTVSKEVAELQKQNASLESELD